eukprot:1139260-Pelagomonas_calceolata.AAC.9
MQPEQCLNIKGPGGLPHSWQPLLAGLNELTKRWCCYKYRTCSYRLNTASAVLSQAETPLSDQFDLQHTLINLEFGIRMSR